MVMGRTAALSPLGRHRFHAHAHGRSTTHIAVIAAEFAAGQRLSRDSALALALGKQARAMTSGPAARSATIAVNSGPLGKREAEVARLVADGLTNRQIGTRLFISERTVDSHVRSILNKLGVNSRAQIAAWLASPGQ
jgi:DNA-binding NarL/FixJ family response regulator